jgi:putative transcriptional regulator
MDNIMTDPLNYSITELNKLEPQKGRLLLAEPFMEDPNFKRSVVLLTGYSQDGVFGFMLNKTLDLKVNDVLKDFPEFNAPIHLGGPVQSDSLFYIHTQGEFIEESIKISEDLYWSGNFNQLKKMIENHEIFPHEIMFFIGYSGWDFEQLADEMIEESWIISDMPSNNIKDLTNPDLWKSTLQKMGSKFSTLSNFPEDPSLN